MRTRFLLSVVATASLVLACPDSASATSATVRVVVRPVTAGGVPAPGYHAVVNRRKSDAVDCRSADPSPGAVDRDIEWCTPSAAYAIACWKAATAHRVLCSRDPRSQRVYSIPRDGGFATTDVASKRNLSPIVLILRDGTVCFIRDGGAWGQLQSHPKWYGTYSCDQHGDVWSRPYAAHDGIDESQPAWTVHTSPSSGNGSVTVRTVAKAYFVGTHA